jgi:hypothetical protein
MLKYGPLVFGLLNLFVFIEILNNYPDMWPDILFDLAFDLPISIILFIVFLK